MGSLIAKKVHNETKMRFTPPNLPAKNLTFTQKLFKDRTVWLLLLIIATPYILFANFLAPIRWILAMAIFAGIFATTYGIRVARHTEGHLVASKEIKKDLGRSRPTGLHALAYVAEDASAKIKKKIAAH